MVQPVSSISNVEQNSLASANNDSLIVPEPNTTQEMDNSYISLLTEPDEDEDEEEVSSTNSQSLLLGGAEGLSSIDCMNNISNITEPSNLSTRNEDSSRLSSVNRSYTNQSSSLMSDSLLEFVYPSGVRPEIVDNGMFLFQGFVRDEFRRQRLQEPVHFDYLFFPFCNDERLSSDIYETGNRLRVLANRFADSPLRNKVREQAEFVSLATFNFNSFSDILYGLFQEGGVTWERVIILFFFCTDLLVRAVREKFMGKFTSIVHWSIRFFSGQAFSRWIQDNGGWGAILSGQSADFFNKYAIIGAVAVAIVVFGMYLRRSR